MKFITTTIVGPHFRGFLRPFAAAIGIVALASAGTAEAQILSAPHDTSTLPPVKAEQGGVGLIASTAARGIERGYRALIPEASGAEELDGVHEGQSVAVHYSQRGEQRDAEQMALVGTEGLDATEGTVTAVNRRRAEISIRLDDQTTETLRVARQNVGLEGPGRVLIYYPNAAGKKVPHEFVIVSQVGSPRAY